MVGRVREGKRKVMQKVLPKKEKKEARSERKKREKV